MPKRGKATAHRSATEEVRGTAALYGAGALEPGTAAAFERHLAEGCGVCATELRAFEETAAQLAQALPERKPPAGLRARLMDRIAQRDAPVNVLVRADEGAWSASGFPGVTLRQLFVDKATGNVTSLVRMEAGAQYPAHRHAGLEHCYVLEGDLVFHDHVLGAGDYEVAMVETEHSMVTTEHGCLLLLINHQGDQVLGTGR